MTERICESCGKRFASETLRDKLEDGAIVLAAILLPIYALHRLSDGEGLVGAISALMNFALAVAAFFEMRKRDMRGNAECAVFGRKCPSCGGRSADMESPLGEQLKAHWSSSPNIGDESQAAPSEPTSVVPDSDVRADGSRALCESHGKASGNEDDAVTADDAEPNLEGKLLPLHFNNREN